MRNKFMAILLISAVTAIATIILALTVPNALAKAKESTDAPQHDRFQLVVSPLDRADQYLLDSQTGATWRYVKAIKGGYSWERIVFIDKPPATISEAGWKQ